VGSVVAPDDDLAMAHAATYDEGWCEMAIVRKAGARGGAWEA
jgi:hypothetical protein